MPDGEERDELTRLVANQMKRALANWNSNALDDEKILDDLAEYTNGKISLLPCESHSSATKRQPLPGYSSNK